MTGEAYIVYQGVFLGDEKAINRVYPEAVRAALAKICALTETVYTKAAVLDAPERFASTAYIFSTWVDIGLFEPEDLPAQPRWTLHALAELAAVTAL